MHVHIHARSARAFTAVALAFAALTACSKEKNESAGDVTPGAAAPAPAASTVAVADIDLGRAIANARVTDKTDDFKATDTVYASVHTTGSAPAAAVMARWTFEDGQVVEESTSVHRAVGRCVHRVPHLEARRSPEGQVQGRGVPRQQVGRNEGLRGEVGSLPPNEVARRAP